MIQLWLDNLFHLFGSKEKVLQAKRSHINFNMLPVPQQWGSLKQPNFAHGTTDSR